MRHIISAISCVLCCLFISCDKITDPVQPISDVESRRKILLEDYTGHQCGNCPGAAEVAEKLYKQHGNKVVTIAVHAGFFSKTNLKYPTSYTTTAGAAWDTYFIGNAGYPNGLINRVSSESGYVQNLSKWSSAVDVALKGKHFVDLKITPSYNAGSRKLNTIVDARFARSYSANTKISLVLIEDSLVGPQLDYREPSGAQYIENFVFMHVLRDDINGVWGTTLKNAPIVYNDSVRVSFPDFEIKGQYNDKQLSIVAFAFNEDTKEVLQAEKIKLR